MDHLDRLFHRLVNNIRSRNPAHLTLPFTVAELYEQVVPYRHNRRELGIETNQDYELAVTRLLSGERGYLLGDESMQETLRRELESQEPDAGVFREFATAEISISPNALQSVGAAPRKAARAEAGTSGDADPVAAPHETPGDADAMTARTAAEDGARPDTPQPASTGSRSQESPATSARAEQSGSRVQEIVAAPAAVGAGAPSRVPQSGFSPDADCRFCGATLPQGKQVKFCPNCGQNLSISRCPACGSEIEAGWKFCITCGRAAGA
jgi:predicted RNA-binding Zn-ribbon protein involved in translation (DUF1610 family)